MAKRGRVVRRGAVAAAPAKAVRRQVDPEEIEDLEDELEGVEEEDEEEEEVAPRRVSRRVVDDDETADVEDPEDDEDEDEEDEPAPVKVSSKRAPAPDPKKDGKAPKAEKAAPAPAPKAVAAQIKTVEQTVADNVFIQMFEALADGDAIVITHIGANKWQIAKGDAVKLGAKKKSNSEAWQEMISPEYVAWNAEWVKKNYEQKKAYAKKLKVSWEPHEDERIDVMRITAAVRTAEGIEKYKPEYRTRSARAALRGG